MYRTSIYNAAMKYNTEFNNLSNMEKMCYLFETNNTPTIRKLGWNIYCSFERLLEFSITSMYYWLTGYHGPLYY